ncbi:MAG: choice-of-anchor J domain-containing protein [Nocardioides sp.]
MRSVLNRWVLLATVLALVATGALAAVLLRPASHRTSEAAAAGACAPGFQPVLDALAEVRAEMRNESAGEADAEQGDADREAGSGVDAELAREAVKDLPMLAGTDPDTWAGLCVRSKRPESLQELSSMFGARAISRLAPYGTYRDGAAVHAAAQAAALRPGSVAGTAGTAHQYGKGPLIVDDPAYPEVNGLGLSHDMGRIDSYAFDPHARRLFAAVGNGGIWRSDDMAGTWRNANGNLPTTVTGAVGWSPARGGTLVALTGEPTFGASAYTGMGAYWSGDLGRHWTRAKGVPAGALGFAVAVDPDHPKKVYAATQLGLFGSTDGGRSYHNVKLPTGRCAGITSTTRYPRCALRNVVTDVVVAKGGGVGTQTKAGTVVATVGWRGGQRKNQDGTVQSPRNGVYRSTSGRPGTFTKLAVTGFAAQDAIGRVELGNAVGPKQDHDFLYALVQDAKLLNNGGVTGIDVPEGSPAKSPLGSTVLNGLYVSGDFGKTWTLLAKGSELAADPASGSALVGTGTATGYQPGVQGWYNQWVQPDPTRADANGVPTRMAFGLEEIWSNELTQAGTPLDGAVPVHFRVVAKYFGGSSCLLLSAGLPACPGDREPTDSNQTTHPDQQDGIWIPDPKVNGGVQLVVGNDGGAYRYQWEKDSDTELDNSHWGPGNQTGMYTLMPYFAAMAKDGTVWGGLQDNGNLKIDGKTRKQYETYGGDGFFAAVDPDDSKTAYEEYTNGAISVTTDGGTSWKSIDPGLTASKFANPFSMDPLSAKHLVTAGREVVETLIGSNTDSGMTDAASSDATTTTWRKVFDLGTRAHPGDASATSSTTDPDNSMSAVAVRGNNDYVAFCGYCDTLNKLVPGRTYFKNGLATNVGGAKPAKKGTSQGWHVVPAKGLPNRYITSIAVDPRNAKHLFVTLGGYTRRWVPPGAVGDVNKQIGKGHLFVSSDGGRSFRSVTGNLPDAPATWVSIRGKQLLVATDVGAFASGPRGTTQATPRFARLGGLPKAPVSSITTKPGNPNKAVLAMFGRGVWTYDFARRIPVPADPGPPPPPTVGTAYQSWDFQSGAQSWTTSGAPTTWSLGTPGHGAGHAEDASGQSFGISGTSYLDNMDASLVSPAVTVTGGPTVLQWSMKQDTEGCCDPVSVDWSTDGTTWKPLHDYLGKNADFPGWTTYALAFSPPAGKVQVRFHFVSDALCSNLIVPVGCSQTDPYTGVRVDDVTLGTKG